MTIYGDLEERLLREFNSSTKETIEDIAFDEEEKNKIIFDISGSDKSVLPELRVDYSDFSNHVFFGSAYSSVSFALKRILDYPLDGQLSAVNEWKNTNSGYENWFFDNFPKDHGHAFLQSGSASEMCIQVRDHENKINFGTGSFTLEAVVKPWENMVAGDIYPIITIASSSADLVSLRFERVTNEKFIEISYGVAGSPLISISASYNAYISGTHHVAVVCDRSNLSLFIDGQKAASGSAGAAGAATGSLNFGVKNVDIGKAYYVDTDVAHYYSGSVDEVRIWATARNDNLIKKNFKRTVYANDSGSLGLYYKFNEPYLTSSNRIIDYSGNDLDGAFSGTYSIGTNYVSGNIESFLVDSGDIILDFTNGRVSNFVTEQRDSGSLYDKDNSSYIFELVPSHLVDDDNTEDQKKFLLLIARHWDRLKLYIQHMSNVYNSTVGTFNNTPSDFLNHVASHYGVDIGGIYESSNLFQYFYGEDVLATGSLDSSMKNVRDQIKRNVVNNLIYVYKTKSTKEAVKAALRTLGLDDETINVNQYSIFSGGLETTREPKTVERRTLFFDGSEDQYVTLHNSSYDNKAERTYQFRFNLFSGSYTGSSAPLTSSIFRIEDSSSGSNVMEAEIWRENISSSLGKFVLYHSSSADSPITSSMFSAYDDRWINCSIYRSQMGAGKLFGFNVIGLDYDDISFHFSGSGTMASVYNPPGPLVNGTRLGTIAGKPLYANLQEVRVWNKILTSSTILENHTKDFESLELEDFFQELGNGTLITHLKLNDKTGSITTDEIHDYVDAKSGSNFTGFSTSAEYNFPGKYIKKLQPSYGYDFNIDNDKIRIKDTDIFGPGDVTEDLQAVSVDFSPVASLNKEIIKWFGGIEKFSNIIGYPYLKYRDEVTEINAYRNKFFSERVGRNGIDFEAYLNIIKWFDSNFTYFLRQIIPLEINPSLSNFVIEPHLLEYNKVRTIFPYAGESSSRILAGTVQILNPIIAETPVSIPTADPGRFGAFGSASAFVTSDVRIDYTSSRADATSFNYKNRIYRKALRDYLSGGIGSGLQTQYGNGYYQTQISCSNFERDVLNANTQFYVSGVHHGGGASDGIDSAYLSSAVQTILSYTSSVHNCVQDSRWQWYEIDNAQTNPRYDHGIGYGGGAGQLWEFVNKSKIGETWMFSISGTSGGLQIGKHTTWNRAAPIAWVETTGTPQDRESVILWPESDSFNGSKIRAYAAQAILTGTLENGSLAASFGPTIDIQDFTSLNVTVVGNVGVVTNRSLTLHFKFQFFDGEIGQAGFESIMSSSFNANVSHYQTQNVHHEYILDVPFSIPNGTVASESFVVGFERELPRSKKMRVFLTSIVGASSTNNAVYTIIVKGTLSKGEKAKDILLSRGI